MVWIHDVTLMYVSPICPYVTGLKIMNSVVTAIPNPTPWHVNTTSHKKKPGFFGEMTASRSGKGNTWDKPGTSC